MRTYTQRRDDKAKAKARAARRSRAKASDFKVKLSLYSEYLMTVRLMRSYIRYAQQQGEGWWKMRKIKRDYRAYRRRSLRKIQQALYKMGRISTVTVR